MATESVQGSSGKTWTYDTKMIGQGGMKDVFFTTDGTHVVGFFRSAVDATAFQRLEKIVGSYRSGIFDGSGGDYWRSRFCWPVDLVKSADGRVGVVAPKYEKNYFFGVGSINNDALSIKGNEKEGKWFASSKVRRYLPLEEKGSWKDYLRLCLNISRAVRRMHAAGLAHSDLSYKNVLVDPVTGTACLIDCDGLVVPGIFPPEVVGTPDFIAPEVVATQGLKMHDPQRKLPSQTTDRYALAVLMYMYLLYRHPLRGTRSLDPDPAKDSELEMGSKALWIEDPKDFSNRVNASQLHEAEKFWGDPSRSPYKIVGPYLAALFEKSFTVGLHNPQDRPIAMEWETALLRTIDLIQPCSNKKCEQGWYVFDNSSAPKCPFCGTAFSGKLPVLNLYSSRDGGQYRADNQRVMVWDGQGLHMWHAHRSIVPNENLEAAQAKRVGYFQIQAGDWYLVNEGLTELVSDPAGTKTPIPVGGKVKLAEGVTILLSTQPGGRLIQVQMAGS